jgi:hypothetical protein
LILSILNPDLRVIASASSAKLEGGVIQFDTAVYLNPGTHFVSVARPTEGGYPGASHWPSNIAKPDA